MVVAAVFVGLLMKSVLYCGAERPIKLSSWFVSISVPYRLFLTLQIALGLWALRWTTQKKMPPPGYAVAFIAVVAAVMSIQGDMLGWQKSTWMLVIGEFLIVELRSIRADRAATDLR
jgi:hypothetical protein